MHENTRTRRRSPGSYFSGASAALACIGLVILVGGVSCFGDFSVEQVPAGVEDAGTPPVVIAPDACNSGELRCDDTWLERCDAGASALPPSWTKVENCKSAALCDEAAGLCIKPACNPRQERCLGAVPQRCGADLTAWEDVEAECTSAAHCSLDPDKCSAEGGEAPCCLAVPCAPGEFRCNAEDIQVCRDDQTDLDLIAECATPELCEASLANCGTTPEACVCEPPACEAGASRCAGVTLERCKEDRTGYEPVEECATEALCALGRESVPLSCEPPACAAGGFACTAEGVLQACNADQTALVVLQACPGGLPFCNAGQGVCTATPCEPGDLRCDGRQVLACRANQSGFDAVLPLCETAELCLDDGVGNASCQTPACPANDMICFGSQLRRCNPGRTDYANFGSPCLRADLCSDVRERCDFCVPNRRECTPNLQSSRTCAPSGDTFGPSQDCPLGCVASTGACQTCDLGSYRCQNGLLSRCNDGLSFTALSGGADCSGATRVTCGGNVVQNTPCGALGCNGARNACNECAGQTRICDGSQAFRSCQPDGTFGSTTACQEGLLCAGSGQCVCTPNAASCDGSELLVCNSSGSAVVPGARCSGASANVLRTCAAGELTTNTCGSGALCAAADDATCPVCIDGDSTCEAGAPFDCVDGQRVARTPCGTGLSCEGAGLCRCAADSLMCDGDALLQCSASRTALEPAPACGGAGGATLRTCSNGALSQLVCASEASCLAAQGGACGDVPADG